MNKQELIAKVVELEEKLISQNDDSSATDSAYFVEFAETKESLIKCNKSAEILRDKIVTYKSTLKDNSEAMIKLSNDLESSKEFVKFYSDMNILQFAYWKIVNSRILD